MWMREVWHGYEGGKGGWRGGQKGGGHGDVTWG